MSTVPCAVVIFRPRPDGTGGRPKSNTHDTSRKVIILRMGWGPVTNRVSPGTKTVTSINSIS
jgi:hypothetical protein